jgi:hypothetical protein
MSSKDSIEEIDELMRKGSNNISVEKIMDKFIVNDKNLILKTDIENSKNFTLLKTLASDMRRKGLKQSAKTLNTFCDWYIKVRVSNGRMSRKEILDAISAIKRESATTTLGAKILGIGEDKK